ncbi:MAG: hypothetical protein HY710_05865 [Candidatus Latescibacteria bacterium]|nr:hypothetical protein [Candidatus Latescibacterota bacterium]
MAVAKPIVPEELQHLIARFILFCREETLLLDGVDLKKTRVTAKKGGLTLQLPYVDRHRRPVLLDVTQQQDRWLLSDGGRILAGCRGRLCQAYLRHVLRWYGLARRDGALILETSAAGFAGKLYTFIRVLRTIDYLIQ